MTTDLLTTERPPNAGDRLTEYQRKANQLEPGSVVRLHRPEAQRRWYVRATDTAGDVHPRVETAATMLGAFSAFCRWYEALSTRELRSVVIEPFHPARHL